MSSVITPESAELRNILPVGSEVVLEWNAAFRVRGRIEAYSSEAAARADVRSEPEEPNPGEGTTVTILLPARD